MSKSIEIDLSDDRLVAIAADMVDGHNYIGALKMLNKNAEINGNDVGTFMLYAEIFDDMGLYEKCVNGWFRYMDENIFENFTDCYEGLAVSYMNLGNEAMSAYYYNKLLSENNELDTAAREEIVKDFLSVEENPLKFAYPPELADCSEVITKGIDLMRSGEYLKAAEVFEEVDERNEKYLSARNYIAMCKVISDRMDEAEQECLAILKKRPDDIQALATLAAVKTETEEYDEARTLARKLLELDVEENDDIYKIATVCCENKLHAEAYKMFCRLSDEITNELSVMFFKAVAAFNSGMYKESFDQFDRLLTIYPDAVTARYFYNSAREMKESGNIEELSYFYRLPQEMREDTLKILAAYARLSPAEIKKLSTELDIGDCIKWCFDEHDGRSGEDLQRLAAMVAVKSGLDEIVSGLLLNAFLPDRLKMDMITAIAERDQNGYFGVVVCHIFKRITTCKLSIGRAKKKYFVKAYARLVGNFSVLDDEHGDAFADAAEKLYVQMENEGRLDAAKDIDALAAVIYINSGVREADITGRKINSFFGVKTEQIKKITGDK